MRRSFLHHVVFFLLCLLHPWYVQAGLYGQADVSYQKTTTRTDSTKTKSTTLNQGYTLGLSKELTSTISITGDAKILITELDGDRQESIYPMFVLNITPPAMYNFTVSYNRTETAPSEGDHITNSNFNVSLLIPQTKWPSLSGQYNRSTTRDYLVPHNVDYVYNNLVLSSIYSFTFKDAQTDLNYSLSYYTMEDKVGLITTEVPTHIGTVNISREFWDRKIKTGVNFGYSWAEYTNTSQGLPTRFEEERYPLDGLYSEDTTPGVDALSSTPSLIDNNTQSGTGIDLNGTYRNIGVKFSTSQNIHKIYLYISTSDTNIQTYVNNNYFKWTVYSSNDGINWSSIGSVSSTYEAGFSRITLTFTETTAQYFKIVNTDYPAGSMTINVTEIEAIGYVLSTPTITFSYTTERRFGGFNLSFTPYKRLSMRYDLTFDHTAQELNNRTTAYLNQGLNMSYTFHPQYLILSTTYSTSSTKTDEDIAIKKLSTDTGTGSYIVTLSSTPLPTLNTSLSYAYFTTSTAGEVVSKSHNISGNVFMNLYRGVDVGIGSTYSKTRDIAGNGKTDSIVNYMNINLLPWQDFNVVINSNYIVSNVKTQDTTTHTTTTTLTSTMSYTPTRKFYFFASVAVEPVSSQSIGITWLPTRNIQTDARYGISETSKNMALNISWSPIKRLVLHAGYTGTVAENDTTTRMDSIFARVSLRF